MNVSTKSFELKIDDADSKGVIRGFASVFGNVDSYGEVVDKGAFKRTIKNQKGRFPILADHDPTKLIGFNERAEETDQGLLIEGRINLDTQAGKEKYSLALQAAELGAPMGLSIGFQTIKAVEDPENPRVRRLKEIKLWEYSIVTFPANPKANITGVKNGLPLDFILDVAHRNGFTDDEIKTALQQGPAVSSDIDPTDDGHSIEEKLDKLIKQLKQG